MKKLNYIISGVMGLALLAGCQEHPMTTINPAAEDGTLTFEINTPAYAGYTYILSADNSNPTTALQLLLNTLHKSALARLSKRVLTKSWSK